MLASVKFGIPGQIKACMDEITKHEATKPAIFLTGGNSGHIQQRLMEFCGKKYKIYPKKSITLEGILDIASVYFGKSV